MSSDIKTLADAQPGGRVRLGDQAERARFKAWWDAARPLEGSAFPYEIAWAAWQAALSAQPSPGGQGDSRSEKAATFLRQYLTYLRSSPRQGLRPRWCDVYEALEVAIEALAARQPSKQPDSVALGEATEFCIENGDRQPVGEPDHLRGTTEMIGQPVGEPIGGFTEDHLTDRSATTYDRTIADRWRAKGWPVSPLYAAPPAQPVGEPVCSGGFVISNGSGEKYMAWGQVGPEWTADRSAALWLVRRADAEALAAENEDAWSILPVERCALPPNGWACTLAAGHEGPCPTIAAPTAQAVDLGQFRVAVYCMQKYTGVLPRMYWDKGSKAFDEEAARLMTVIDGAEVVRG